MRMATLLLTAEEMDALAVAVAKSVDPTATPTNASEASAVVWAHHGRAGQPLCGLTTLLAEEATSLRHVDAMDLAEWGEIE